MRFACVCQGRNETSSDEQHDNRKTTKAGTVSVSVPGRARVLGWTFDTVPLPAGAAPHSLSAAAAVLVQRPPLSPLVDSG